MFGAPVSQGLTLSKVISGISKTLGIANQVIPLYVKAKPMIKNAKDAFKVAKVFMEKPKQNNEVKNKVIDTPTKKVETINSTNKPVFFL